MHLTQVTLAVPGTAHTIGNIEENMHATHRWPHKEVTQIRQTVYSTCVLDSYSRHHLHDSRPQADTGMRAGDALHPKRVPAWIP